MSPVREAAAQLLPHAQHCLGPHRFRADRMSVAALASRPEVGSSMNSREGLATSSRPMFTRFRCPPLQGAGSGCESGCTWGGACPPLFLRQQRSAAQDILTHNVPSVVLCAGQEGLKAAAQGQPACAAHVLLLDAAAVSELT